MRTLHIVYDDELLELRRNSREARDTPVVRIADFLFTERMKNRISEWRDGLLLNRNGGFETQESSNDTTQQLQTIFFKMRPALLLNGFTSHQLRLIQLVMIHNFSFFFHICYLDLLCTTCAVID